MDLCYIDMDSGMEDVPAEQAVPFEPDALHANNPQYCTDYVNEIFQHLIATEEKLLPSSSYMESVSCPSFSPSSHAS